MEHFDYVIIGAGIVGLSITRSLLDKHPDSRILVLEKEPETGVHASGRNSGVLHSGIYYTASSLKARVCSSGSRAMMQYCQIHNLPIHKTGKIILPTSSKDDDRLDLLQNRAELNGARAEIIDSRKLKEIEPEAYSPTGRALLVPDTTVINPRSILEQLLLELKQKGVAFRFNTAFQQAYTAESTLYIDNKPVKYGHVFNAAGAYADKVAHAFDIGHQYTLLPFKGAYYKLDPNSGIQLNHLIYPVPDLDMPFLGIHSVITSDGHTYFGPSALPALGPEHYHGIHGIQLNDGMKILLRLIRQYIENKQNFRAFSHTEASRFTKRRFAYAAQKIVPRLKPEHLLNSTKVGIRAQLLNLESRKLEMDFIVEHGVNSTHILNAVSPAFTSAFSFAELILSKTDPNVSRR